MTRTRLLIAAILLTGYVARGELLYRVDFEDGTLDASYGSSKKEEWYGGEVSVVDNPSIDGRNGSAKAGRCRVPHDYTRAELSGQRLPTAGRTYVYRWSYYLPPSFYDSADIDWTLISQWKTWPCGYHDGYDAEICPNCGIFNDLSAGTRDNPTYRFRWRAQPDCYEHTLAAAPGEWTTFTMEIKWSTASDGYAVLLANDELIYERHGFRTLFDRFDSTRCNVYWAVGLYTRWQGAKEYLDVFVDNVEIWDSSGIGNTAASTESPPVDAPAHNRQILAEFWVDISGRKVDPYHRRLGRYPRGVYVAIGEPGRAPRRIPVGILQ